MRAVHVCATRQFLACFRAFSRLEFPAPEFGLPLAIRPGESGGCDATESKSNPRGKSVMRTACVFWAKSGLVGLILLASALDSGPVTAQSSDPSALPLLSSDGLQYVGGFRLPAESSNNEW